MTSEELAALHVFIGDAIDAIQIGITDSEIRAPAHPLVRPTEETGIVRFHRATSWIPGTSRDGQCHAVVGEPRSTWCDGSPASPGAESDELTCPDCLFRALVVEALFPQAPRARRTAPASTGTAITLHVEMTRILQADGDRGMTPDALAAAVNHAGRYQKKRGLPHVAPSQIRLRARAYPQLFVGDGSHIRRREA